MIKNKALILALIIMVIFSACGKQTNPDTDTNVNNNPANQDEQNKGDDQQSNNEQNSSEQNKGEQNNQNNDTEVKKVVQELIIAETLKDYVDDKDQINKYIDANVEGKLKFISGKELFKSSELKTVGGKEGILLSEIMDSMGMIDSDSYIITSVANSSIGVTKNDCQKGILYIDDNGDYAVKFEELSERTNIKKIVSISVDK